MPLPRMPQLPVLALLLLLLLPLCWASPRPVAAATAAGGLGFVAFIMMTAWRPKPASPDATVTADSPVAAARAIRPLSSRGRLPLSSQISADYSGADRSPLRGVSDFPASLFQVAQQEANPQEFNDWRVAEQKAQEAARVTHFAWTIPRWKGVRSIKELESPEFRDSLMKGVSWRCLLRREPGGQRLLVLVKAAQLDPGDFPEGRLFAEVTCACEGVRKSTFGAFYPGVYEFALGLDSLHRLGGDSGAPLTVSCTAAVLGRVRVHQLPQLPPVCQVDGRGRYVTCHPVGMRWRIPDWEQFTWHTGWGIFSPLFSSGSLPGYLWQVHLFPASDDPSSAGHVSAFLKLVDSTAAAVEADVEVDFQLILQGDEDAGLCDTAGFARGGTRGFRGIRRLGDLRGGPLVVECAMRVKLPLFT